MFFHSQAKLVSSWKRSPCILLFLLGLYGDTQILDFLWLSLELVKSWAGPTDIIWSNLSCCTDGETEARKGSGLALRTIRSLCLSLSLWEPQRLGDWSKTINIHVE